MPTTTQHDQEIADQARTKLRSLLGDNWHIAVEQYEPHHDDTGYDEAWAIRHSCSPTRDAKLCVEVSYDVTPARVRQSAIRRLAEPPRGDSTGTPS